MTFAEQLGSVKRSLHRALLARLAVETKRPFQQLLALRVIAREQVRTQSELAERLLIDRPAASRLVDRLERDGLLERKTGADRRCVSLEVTPSAAGELEALERALAWLDGELRRHSSAKDLKAMVRLMRQLQESFTRSLKTGAAPRG